MFQTPKKVTIVMAVAAVLVIVSAVLLWTQPKNKPSLSLITVPNPENVNIVYWLRMCPLNGHIHCVFGLDASSTKADVAHVFDDAPLSTWLTGHIYDPKADTDMYSFTGGFVSITYKGGHPIRIVLDFKEGWEHIPDWTDAIRFSIGGQVRLLGGNMMVWDISASMPDAQVHLSGIPS